jgi:hypothetical protein
MLRSPQSALALVACLALGSCSFVNDAVWPSLSGTPPQDPAPAEVEETDGSDPSPAVQDQSITDIENALENVEAAIRPPRARVPFTTERLGQLDRELEDRARRFSFVDPMESTDPQEAWADLQIELSRFTSELERLEILRREVAADAALAAEQLAVLENISGNPAIAGEGAADSLADQHASLQADVDTLLAALGRQNAAIGAVLERWETHALRQATRLDTLRPPEPVEAEPRPTRPTPAPTPASPSTDDGETVSGPLASGERFKGRQPLATLNFADPNLAFEEQLRGLLARVKAQYPDVAFDVESVGASADTVARVEMLLAELDIPAATYSAQLAAGATPEVKLYPR